MNKEEENDGNEFVRIELTGLNYPHNTDRNLDIRKKMLEIDVLEKLSAKLDGDEFDEDEDEDEDEDKSWEDLGEFPNE